MSYIGVFLVSFCIFAVSGKTVFYKDCGSVKAKVVNVDVNPCPKEPCILHRGHNVTFSIQFNSTETVTKGKSVVHGIISGVPAPFPLSDPDLCKFSKPACPFKAKNTYTYSNQFIIKSFYPKINLVVKWELKDDQNNDLVCILVPVAIDD